MKAFVVSKRQIFAAAALALLLVAGSLSLFALSAKQVARVSAGQTFKAQCCVAVGPTVSVTEPATPQAVIVTFNTDYVVDGTAQFGLSVNGGPCAFYGATVSPSLTFGPGSNGAFNSSTFNWVVLPSDGLVPGSNTFTLCGGGASAPVNITLGFRTLTVQIGK